MFKEPIFPAGRFCLTTGGLSPAAFGCLSSAAGTLAASPADDELFAPHTCPP